jgi:hypothetical protein
MASDPTLTRAECRRQNSVELRESIARLLDPSWLDTAAARPSAQLSWARKTIAEALGRP